MWQFSDLTSLLCSTFSKETGKLYFSFLVTGILDFSLRNFHLMCMMIMIIKTIIAVNLTPGGGTLQIFGRGCAAGTLKPLP